MFSNLNFFQILAKGGPVFVILLFCSIFSLAIILERIYVLISIKKKSKAFINQLIYKLKNKGVHEALEFCKENNSIISKIFLVALERKEKSKEVIEEAMQRQGLKLSLFLEKNLVILAITGSITPFIGLFGTVLGIINAFNSISLAEVFSPSLVSSGISEALLNTAAGLFVAVPAVIAYNILLKQIHSFQRELEITGSEIIERLKEYDYGII